LTARELPGTEGATFPFWCPDGRTIGFFANEKLKRMDLAGGAPLVIADIENGRGTTCNRDGTILFTSLSQGGLNRIATMGGTPPSVSKIDAASGETAHRWPQFLPDGNRFIYYIRSSRPHATGIYLSSLDHPEKKTHLAESSAGGFYAPPRGDYPAYL